MRSKTLIISGPIDRLGRWRRGWVYRGSAAEKLGRTRAEVAKTPAHRGGTERTGTNGERGRIAARPGGRHAAPRPGCVLIRLRPASRPLAPLAELSARAPVLRARRHTDSVLERCRCRNVGKSPSRKCADDPETVLSELPRARVVPDWRRAVADGGRGRPAAGHRPVSVARPRSTASTSSTCSSRTSTPISSPGISNCAIGPARRSISALPPRRVRVHASCATATSSNSAACSCRPSRHPVTPPNRSPSSSTIWIGARRSRMPC